MRSKHNKGFTLIELIITIAILGILATIALTQYFSYINRARIVSAQAHLKNIQIAIEARAEVATRRKNTENSMANPSQKAP